MEVIAAVRNSKPPDHFWKNYRGVPRSTSTRLWMAFRFPLTPLDGSIEAALTWEGSTMIHFAIPLIAALRLRREE
jgi:hypothetical protein